MKRLFPVLSALCLLTLAAAQAALAQAPAGPPQYMYVEREVLRPGAAEGHARESNDFVRLLAHAKDVQGERRYYRVGLTPVAGNSNEVLYLFPFESLDAVGRYQSDVERWMTRPGEMNAFNAKVRMERPSAQAGAADDYHTLQTSSVARRVDDLSYNPRTDLGSARFVEVITWRVKPGQEMNFVKAGRMIVAAHKEARTPVHFVTFRLMGGGPSGTFMTVSSLATLEEMNPPAASMAAYMKALGEKAGEVDKLAGESLAGSETNIYRIVPTMSAVPDSFLQNADDRAFWTTTLPAPPAAPAATAARPAANSRRRP